MKKVLLILNCHDKVRGYDKVVPLLKDKFPYKSLEISQQQKITDIVDDIKMAVKGDFSAVIVGGGDGTIGLAASVLTDTQIPMMILPMGTVNAFARSFGIPRNPIDALNHYQIEKVKQIDTGFANENFFLCFMSIGVDAFAVHLLDKKLKSVIGKSAYVISGIKSLLRYSYLHPFINDGKKYFHLIVSNMSNYAGYRMFPLSDFSDGRMSCVINDSSNPASTLYWTYELAANKISEYDELQSDKNMVLSFEKPLYAQFDGEPVKITPDPVNKNELVIGVKKESLIVYY